ncbi:hypothetical protein [Sphingomonas baiyangensis]|uniref:PepSY domain-containing protein n=1 Tax=Sphingomonas baiyangensis TaxID=2572576 RepID=A0A4U1L8I6_9SPHN|nr:hypothetical protein [Sphingomonas baiyangensis]TKD53124.1 hypothetical protein FBR43_01950 [Sphingomonas baiyangensis]
MKPILPMGMLAAMMLVAGCGGGSAPAVPPANDMAEPATTNFQAQVAALDDERRNLVMIRAIRDAGLNCQEVTSSRRTESEGMTYLATCDAGTNFLVTIGADGNARVVTGADVR